ncbi:unnamed protein product, partial [Rotaria sp. Silwood2]
GQSPSNIYQRMVVVYSDHAPSRATVFEWIQHFKHGKLNIEDSPRSGQPITATNDQTIKVVENLIIEDCRITLQRIADTP